MGLFCGDKVAILVAGGWEWLRMAGKLLRDFCLYRLICQYCIWPCGLRDIRYMYMISSAPSQGQMNGYPTFPIFPLPLDHPLPPWMKFHGSHGHGTKAADLVPSRHAAGHGCPGALAAHGQPGRRLLSWTYDWVDLEDSCSHMLGVLQIIILSVFFLSFSLSFCLPLFFSDVMFLLSSSCFFLVCVSLNLVVISQKKTHFFHVSPPQRRKHDETWWNIDVLPQDDSSNFSLFLHFRQFVG